MKIRPVIAALDWTGYLTPTTPSPRMHVAHPGEGDDGGRLGCRQHLLNILERPLTASAALGVVLHIQARRPCPGGAVAATVCSNTRSRHTSVQRQTTADGK